MASLTHIVYGPLANGATTRFINPVCGVAVDTAAPKHVLAFEDIAYYFCCDCCLAAFRDPAKYAAIRHASTARLAAGCHLRG